MKKTILPLLILISILASCSTMKDVEAFANRQNGNAFLIKHIEKHYHPAECQDVYIMVIERNDTLYPLFSRYDEKKGKEGGVKLKPGMYCNASLESHLQLLSYTSMIYDIAELYYGIELKLCPDFKSKKYKRKCFKDVFTSPELNGRYWLNQKKGR